MRIDTEAQRVIWSASDLKAAAECEFAWSRAIDAKLGRVPAVEEPEDATLLRAAQLGDVHEQNVLERYIRELGDERVHRVAKVSSSDPDALAAAVDETLSALRSDALVVFQAAFATDEFVGFADFLRRDADGRWRVQDSKLARKARVTALMQLAAYVDQLDRLGIPRADEVDLIHGDNSVSTHAVEDLLPLFRVRRARLRALIADRSVADGAAGAPLAWGDDRGDLRVVACGRCATCEEQVLAHRDLLMVARMRPVQRARLRAAGILTIDDLAAATQAPEGMNVDTFENLRAQARVQLRADAEGAATYDVHYAAAIHTLPVPSHGDIFFDFEGDPLYTEPAPDGEAEWGIDYLFGWVDNADQYTTLWAHSFAEERRALETFLDFVKVRRAAHPGMHIYHYAPTRPPTWSRWPPAMGCARVRWTACSARASSSTCTHWCCAPSAWVRGPTRSRSSSPSTWGGRAHERRPEGRRLHRAVRRGAGARGSGGAGRGRRGARRPRRLQPLRLRLHPAAAQLAHRHRARGGVTPAPPDDADEVIYEPSPRSLALLGDAERAVEVGGDGLVHRLAAAAIDYFPREAKSFWVAHFQRLREPVTMWDGTRDVVKVDATRSRVRRDWSIGEGRRVLSRELEIRGEVSPGTTLGPGAQPFAFYDVPAPFDTDVPSRAVHVPHGVTVVEVLDDGYLVAESAVQGQTWNDPRRPHPRRAATGGVAAAGDRRMGRCGARGRSGLPQDAATDILRRLPPRTVSGNALPAAGDDPIDAIVRGILDLDRSYLAVQGPPGTGKTYTGSQVIARLVTEHGFRIGVVAQSHAIIETLLERVVADGVAPGQVAKCPRTRTPILGTR